MHLGPNETVGQPDLILIEVLPNADDGGQEVRQRRVHLAIDRLIPLIGGFKWRLGGYHQAGPPLRVTQDDILAQPLQHLGRYLAGESAARFPVHVLGAQLDPGRPQRLPYGSQRGERGAKDPLDSVDLIQREPDAADKSQRHVRPAKVHFPVAGNDWPAQLGLLSYTLHQSPPPRVPAPVNGTNCTPPRFSALTSSPCRVKRHSV